MTQLITRFPSHDKEAPALFMDNIHLAYNGNVVLQNVNLRIQAGELVAVVGPNGAGKTTLLKIIVGVLKPNRGKVNIFGHMPGGHVCIAYVPQRSQVDWSFPVTVDEVVMMGRIRKIGPFRWPQKKDWGFIRQALRQVGMSEYADRQIGELSGGQQQRVFLAQALAQEAEIILLDEPFTGLDISSQEAIIAMLHELKQTGVTILVSTHDLSLANEHFDKVVLINRRLVAFGKPTEVFIRPNLLEAYGGHVHDLPEAGGTMVLAETCCGDEPEANRG
jgi:manganese/iron transport system ATP-binding protein